MSRLTSFRHWRAEFHAPEHIVIGERTVTGYRVFLDGRSGLRIGGNVSVTSHVATYTRQHHIDAAGLAEVGAPVRIEDYAYIGSHAIILPGVTIGRARVVGSGSKVRRDVEPYTLVEGLPARFARHRPQRLTYQLGCTNGFV